MSTIRIPTPLRPYTDGQKEIEVQAETVEQAVQKLLESYPALKTHLLDENGQLRPYVNLFVNEADIRELEGPKTPVRPEDRLMIVPSIAGGTGEDPAHDGPFVDHAALKTNQAIIILLLLGAFVLDLPLLVLACGLIMLLGTALGEPGFLPVYRGLQRLGVVKAKPIPDHPAPHRFAQGLGGLFNLAAAAALFLGNNLVGWALAWVVTILAGLNLFFGFCAGCAMYYWLARLGAPGFRALDSPSRRDP